MALLSRIKAAVKRFPPIYDLIDRYRPIQLDATERFLDAFSKQSRSVSFLQIGANDGMSWDPLRRYIIRDRWSGVLVEPVPANYRRLIYNYRHVKQDLVFVNAAISIDDNSRMTFHVPSKPLLARLDEPKREYLWRCASFSREHLEAAMRSQLGSVSTSDIVELQVPCLSVNSLLDQYWSGRDLDLFVCDAEGYDAQIIRSVDFERVRVSALVFESHNLTIDDRTRVEAYLARSGFRLTQAEGDTIAVR